MPSSIEGKKHMAEYVYDFDVDGGAQGAITLSAKTGYSNLPVGAIVTDVMIYVETAMTSGGSATILVGTSGDTNGYFVQQAMDAKAVNTVLRAGEIDGDLIWSSTPDAKMGNYVSNAATGTVLLTIETADLTAGKWRIIFEYYMTRTQG